MSKLIQLTGIDITKFIMSFAVIAIHVSAGSCTGIPLPTGVEYIVRLAVPFFFICSGFLVTRKIELMEYDDISAMFRKRSLQLFRIFGIWLLIYLPITIYHSIEKPKTIWKIIGGYIANVFLSGESYLAWPLWFIYSMAIIFLIFSFINILKKRSVILLFMIFLSVPILEYMSSYYPTGIVFLLTN